MSYFPNNNIEFNANQPRFGGMPYGGNYQQQPQSQPQQQQRQSQSQPQPQGGLDRARFMKRQASQLRSLYPLSRWCAVYVNTNAIGGKSLDPGSQVNDSNLLDPIEHYDIGYLNMELEEEIVVTAESQEISNRSASIKITKKKR